MTRFFKFEADFVESLHCIPMQVRLKLDTCGIKLKLNQWNRFNKEDQESLIQNPCQSPEEITQYRQFLQGLVLDRTGESAKDLAVEDNPPWMNEAEIPDGVQDKAQQFGITLTLEQWAKLEAIERFALIKLSRSSHENANFLPALKELNLV
ncbi:nitrate reductase associated protein [Oscillatoria acuminata]|uniref:Nitrate reductase associated protein n=1 Tax=Oscillatoria acuminata PCC 6304 TaxID=56110 RepID=K9TP76_9CYAN|nr:nitrate reductase associated protein [Oscillatoria acuminata]AFY83784.1 hypothetical protein Oscil6304_4257 [Oscillatoria acuminata PCC 6304]